jgi:hypothetical protein
MLGHKSGVTELLKDEFPSVIIWRCASRRLELSVASAVKAVAGISGLRSFVVNMSFFLHHQGTAGNE